ncbi:mechanosensitive ion channel domain-containing protein [Pseudomonas sp.]|jgi:small-conductance mechanosensitive channel|uniref:mechanosensitive ion channel domain-containing protein n=1 Tax=Pseudomonas sp. TaxID=306 RepID=UPI00272C9399|nr:mechanosensitive ion channel domain-containing protein [Pseudomonas sp.]
MSEIQAFLAGVVLSDSVIGLLISSLILLITVFLLRGLSARFIRRHVQSPELRGKWLVNSRNGFLLLLLLGLVLIWGEELRTLALSIVAIAVAFVVATKELILCFTGSLLKSGSGSFKLGDRIQVKDFRGDVIDQSLLATTILEVGPGKLHHQRTGRIIVIPNALFVSEPVINESFADDFEFHVFSVPFKREDDWPAAQQLLLESAVRHCAPYLEQARRYMSRLGSKRGLTVPSVDPRVTIQVPTPGEIQLLVRVATRPGQRSQLEQSILSEVLSARDFSVRRPPDEPAASAAAD